MAVNADVNINVGVQSRRMETDERWTPTTIRNYSFNYETDLEGYLELLETIGTTVYNHIEAMRADGWHNYVHLNVRLDNATHVPVAKGVVPLAKGNRDARLTGEEIVAPSSIQAALSDIIADLKQRAKY